MPVSKAIQTRPVNPELLRRLQAAGADPLLARLFAARPISGEHELEDRLSSLIPFSELTNCTS